MTAQYESPHTPHRAQTIGMWLFLASLAMLFGASMLGYALIRLTSSAMPAERFLKLPWTLWISTALVLSASFTVHQALRAIQHERQDALRRNLLITLGLAIAFVLVQIPSLISMLMSHADLRTSGVHLYGLVFTLVVVHAAHVLGGIVALGLVIRKAFASGYDHEHHIGVYHTALYWHFLDIVWLVMFGTMLLLG